MVETWCWLYVAKALRFHDFAVHIVFKCLLLSLRRFWSFETNHSRKTQQRRRRQYDVGLAINCLANIATPGLSRDLISDLVQLLGNHKPYVRKKALLAM